MFEFQPAQQARPQHAVTHWLIDADNVLPATITESQLRHFLLNFTTSATTATGPIEQVSIRLYGGWRQRGIATQRASDWMRIMSTAWPFPFPLARNRVIRGTWTLAESLLSHPQVDFGDTLRQRSGPPRLRPAKSLPGQGCQHSSATTNCPAHILKRLTKTPHKTCTIQGCTATSAAMFDSVEQKQVDAMLTLDMLHLSTTYPESSIVCISDDTDFIPGLVASSAFCKHLSYCNLHHDFDSTSQQLLADLSVRRISDVEFP